MRRTLLLFALLTLTLHPAGAATDVAAAGQGNGTLKHSGVTCTGPLAVTINVRSNQAVVTENWGPGSPGIEACAIEALTYQYEADTTPYPPAQTCATPIKITTGAPFTLTQSGSVYTLQSAYKMCDGTQVVDKVVVTVQPTRILYSHTFTRGAIVEVNASGSLPRLA